MHDVVCFFWGLWATRRDSWGFFSFRSVTSSRTNGTTTTVLPGCNWFFFVVVVVVISLSTGRWCNDVKAGGGVEIGGGGGKMDATGRFDSSATRGRPSIARPELAVGLQVLVGVCPYFISSFNLPFHCRCSFSLSLSLSLLFSQQTDLFLGVSFTEFRFIEFGSKWLYWVLLGFTGFY